MSASLPVRQLALRGYLPAKVKRILSDMTIEEWDTTPKRSEFNEKQLAEIDEAVKEVRGSR